MATTTQLRADITKLKKAIASKFTPKSAKSKLEAQLKKVEKELADKKAGKKTTSTTASTKATFKSLKDLVRRTKELSIYKGSSEADLKNDADRSALPSSAVKGRRVSKGLRSNQYGTKGSNKGHVYYEYRKNRIDVKQPRSKQKYPILEDGGMMAKGGKLKVNGEDFSFLLELSDKELSKRLDLVRKQKNINAKQYFSAREKGESTTKIEESGNNLDNQERAIIEARIRNNKMADGGMMAKGGETSKKYAVIHFKDKKSIKKKYDSSYKAFSDYENQGVDYVELFNERGDLLSSYPKKDKMADGGMMAKGGAVEHGLMQYDTITDISKDGKTIYIQNEKERRNGGHSYYKVEIETGTRTKWDGYMMAEGGMEMPNGGGIQSSTHKLHR